MVSGCDSVHTNLEPESWTVRGGLRRISDALDTLQAPLLLGDT